MSKATPLPVDHPGTFIEEELDARGWAKADLAYILGMDDGQLNKLIKGHTNITPDSAVMLADAFDMPAEFFMNLQKMYDLQKARKADPGVKTRASWLSVFPVREMIKRGWIENTEPALLDLQMMRFFDKNRIEDIPFVNDNVPVMAHAAKKSSGYDSTTPVQYVWLHRVRKIAEQMECPLYSETALRDALPKIRAHMIDRDDFVRIPDILRQCGVRLVFVQHLEGSKIDGVCVWLGGQPVIGMSLRLNRPDNFCFVLRHEIEHILQGDGKAETFTPVDEYESDAAVSCDKPDFEKAADIAALEFCVPNELLDSFIKRKSPFISERDVLSFAARLEINPAVVIGQIQHKTGKYAFLRKYLTGLREPLIENWAHTDGWGFTAPTGL
jgi:HTH-type transcriptional regulator / antitoxin HigA